MYIHSSYLYPVSVPTLKVDSALEMLVHRRPTTNLLYHTFHISMFRYASCILPPSSILLHTGHPLNVAHPSARTVGFLSSLFHRTAKDWNGLPLPPYLASWKVKCLPSKSFQSLSSQSSHRQLCPNHGTGQSKPLSCEGLHGTEFVVFLLEFSALRFGS